MQSSHFHSSYHAIITLSLKLPCNNHTFIHHSSYHAIITLSLKLPCNYHTFIQVTMQLSHFHWSYHAIITLSLKLPCNYHTFVQVTMQLSHFRSSYHAVITLSFKLPCNYHTFVQVTMQLLDCKISRPAGHQLLYGWLFFRVLFCSLRSSLTNKLMVGLVVYWLRLGHPHRQMRHQRHTMYTKSNKNVMSGSIKQINDRMRQ